MIMGMPKHRASIMLIVSSIQYVPDPYGVIYLFDVVMVNEGLGFKTLERIT
jgi:hypothetical protein